MKNLSVISAPSTLGLKPSGVEELPRALKEQGLLERLGAIDAGTVVPGKYYYDRSIVYKTLNASGIIDYTLNLSYRVAKMIKEERFPLVLGGDCSITLGNMLGLRKAKFGKMGLIYIDGHADFYEPEKSPTGEIADMSLGFLTGRGPDALTSYEFYKPLVYDANTILFGYRDEEESKKDGSRDVRETQILSIDCDQIKSKGVNNLSDICLERLSNLSGFWIHLDVDVLDDKLMPAVDYRMPKGLSYTELGFVMKKLINSRKCLGMDVTIFNPKLDYKDKRIAKELTSFIVDVLS